ENGERCLAPIMESVAHRWRPDPVGGAGRKPEVRAEDGIYPDEALRRDPDHCKYEVIEPNTSSDDIRRAPEAGLPRCMIDYGDGGTAREGLTRSEEPAGGWQKAERRKIIAGHEFRKEHLRRASLLVRDRPRGGVAGQRNENRISRLVV